MTFMEYLLERFEEMQRMGKISVMYDNDEEEISVVCRRCGEVLSSGMILEHFERDRTLGIMTDWLDGLKQNHGRCEERVK